MKSKIICIIKWDKVIMQTSALVYDFCPLIVVRLTFDLINV